MAQYRPKYQSRIESGDAPPVTTMPVQGAEPPPAADTKPSEPPAETESPAEQAGKLALKQRLAEMERAEAITREAVSHPQFATEPQEPQQPTTEEIIAASGLPDRAKAWLRERPEYVTDPVQNARLQKLHAVAEHQAGGEWTPEYFDRMEILLGLKQEASPSGNGQVRAESRPPVSAPTAPRNAALPRPRMAAPVSAPPTRERSDARPV
jgi:hypothetical protein